LLLLEPPDLDRLAFACRLPLFPDVSARRFGVVVSLDDFEFAAEVGAESRVIVMLTGNRVIRSGEGRKDWSRKVFDRGCLKCEADRLTILFEQNTGKNALNQGADVQPFVRGVLETAVVQVVAVDIDARS